ncbi:hypothetical protein [Streptomyces sp. NBC_00094]|uniref:hypothetical protein n=1 Tax=Streptomyces sp. NBC_00094 TaxID=2903620 RepID=UPI00225BC320|nr:hypothetical protein [Streptomyces sp. NBC_00094]MCX5389045.1 hypothetical protein [Streptomyces sp. NBC_00094]
MAWFDTVPQSPGRADIGVGAAEARGRVPVPGASRPGLGPAQGMGPGGADGMA